MAPDLLFDALEETFHAGSKPASERRIGVEYEKPVVLDETGEAVPYEGDRGIGRLLAEMQARNPKWKDKRENGNIVALTDGKASITLEPGGQFEMSGEQCVSLHCALDELRSHVNEIVPIGDEMGISFLGLGITPQTAVAEVPHMPKKRYRIMRRVMSEVGTLGHRMMHQTATVQCNFDYENELDARDKTRVAMAMGPVLVAVSANSPIVDGRDSGYLSYRSHVWSDTDSNRCGYLPFVFNTDGFFGAYARWAMDVPMYFLERDDDLVEVDDTPFSRMLATGHNGEPLTIDDWKVHLTTLFPEVRLKTYIEVRSADSQPTPLMLATPALMKGIFYDTDCLAAAWDVVKKLPLSGLPDLHEDAGKRGLAARVGRHSLKEYSLELLAIARTGLARQAELDAEGRDEGIYLDRLESLVKSGRCPADLLLEKWRGDWDGQMDALVKDTRYRVEDEIVD